MKISGLTKLTLLDFPDHIACIIFTQGCNFNCQFCHNSSLLGNYNSTFISENEIFAYLHKRKNILDGVVISGGEPLLQKDIKEFLKKIKNFNLAIKLDTNGTNPDLLNELINDNLIDYVAMDIKNDLDNYFSIIGTNININNIKKSITILQKSNINYEFRTTVVKEFHTMENIINICKLIGNSKYYLQNFVLSDNVVNRNLTPFTKLELDYMIEKINKKYTNVKIRNE